MTRSPKPTPVAVRVHVESPVWKIRPAPLSKPPSPRLALLIETAPRDCAGEPLRLGAYSLVATGGQEYVLERGLFYPKGTRRTERDRLAAYARAHGWPEPMPLQQFLNRLFKLGYKDNVPIVGFGLPTHLCRLAADWGRATRAYAGGFSLILWTKKPKPGRSQTEKRRRRLLRNGEVEDGFRPRINIGPGRDGSALMAFGKRGSPDERDRLRPGSGGKPDPSFQPQGLFVDLARFAFGRSGRKYPSAAAASKAFGEETEPEPRRVGVEGECDRLLTRLASAQTLYLALLDDHQRHSQPGLTPARVFSPASEIKAALQTAGVTEPLLKWPDFPRSALGQTMGAYHGGESLVGIRALPWPLPVTMLDFSGLYLLIAILSSSYDLLTAAEVEVVVEDPAEVVAWIRSLRVDDLLRPETWRRLAHRFVEIVPSGDVLPHKSPAGQSWLLKVSPLSYPRPLPFTLADAVTSYFETGRVPNILSAFALVSRGRQAGLKPVTLASGRTVQPGEDLFLALGEERLRATTDLDRPEHERERLNRVFKLMASAGCSGIFAEVNLKEPTAAEKDADRWGPDGESQEIKITSKAEPGRWYFPPLAASINGGGRLLTHIARLLAERIGGTVAYQDTDSLAVVSTPGGGLIACPGGKHETGQGAAAVAALPYALLEDVRSELEPLNPYPSDLRPFDHIYQPLPEQIDNFGNPLPAQGMFVKQPRPGLLRIEPENYAGGPAWPKQAYLHARASKAYDLYQLDIDGPHIEIHPEGARIIAEPKPPRPRIVKASEHGLGHLNPPTPEWIPQGKHYLLCRELDLQPTEPDWLDQPALAVIALTRFDELDRLQPEGRGCLRPWSRLAVAQTSDTLSHEDRVIPIAPWHRGFRFDKAAWCDWRTAMPLRVAASIAELTERDLSAASPRQVSTYRTVFARHARRSEAKAVTPDGSPCTADTRGVLETAPTNAHLLRLLGPEATNQERVGITETPSYQTYNDLDDDTWQTLYHPALRTLGNRVDGGLSRIAADAGLSRRAVTKARGGSAGKRVRAALIPVLGRLAVGVLRGDSASLVPAADPAAACHDLLRFLKGEPHRNCLSCGLKLGSRQRKWCRLCRQKPRLRASAEPAPSAVAPALSYENDPNPLIPSAATSEAELCPACGGAIPQPTNLCPTCHFAGWYWPESEPVARRAGFEVDESSLRCAGEADRPRPRRRRKSR